MTFDAWTQAITAALSNFWAKIALFVPNLMATLLIVFVGLFIVRLISKGVSVGLNKIGTDQLFEHIGLAKGMRMIGIEASPSQSVANLIRFFLILLIILSATESLGLERISAVMDEFVLYLPKALGAILVIVSGMFLAHHLKRSVSRALTHMGVDYANAVAQVIYGIVLLITASLAINQLEISTGLLDTFFTIVLASIGLALALSFGLGARGISSQLVSGVYLREQLVPGETLVLGTERGTVLAVGTVNTLVQVGDELRRIPNEKLLTTVFGTTGDTPNDA